VFANAHRQSDEARHADIVLMPGVGFDVVPTDCLAATLVKALPAATSMALAFESGGKLSPGTAKTSVEGLAGGGCVREDGKLKWVPLAYKTREIPFEHGKRLSVTIPWGDVFDDPQNETSADGKTIAVDAMGAKYDEKADRKIDYRP